MKKFELQQLSPEEKAKLLLEEQNNLMDLRFSHELKQLTNTAKLKQTRKTIARLKTMLSAKTSAQTTTEKGE